MIIKQFHRGPCNRLVLNDSHCSRMARAYVRTTLRQLRRSVDAETARAVVFDLLFAAHLNAPGDSGMRFIASSQL